MAASPSEAVIRRKSAEAVYRFKREVIKKLGEGAFTIKGDLYYNGRHATIFPRVIHASNGEVAMWPVAKIFEGCKFVKAFPGAPWMENGCTVEAVVGALQ